MSSYKVQRTTATLALVSTLFFLSGAAGLIYQTVWVRLLELYFGVTLTAITLIVSAYMAGLGLGSLIGGRIASRSRNTILLYGLIEAGIGVFGIASPALIHWVGQQTAGSPYPIVFSISFALLLIPTLLMGMTLPLLTQAFVARVETSGQVVGWLYGINTLGAAIGALVSGYALMGWYGFGGTLHVAAALNFLVGVGAIPLRPRAENQLAQERETKREDPFLARPIWTYEAILASAFLVGFIGMGFEMLWFRLLGVLSKGTAYSFPSILSVFLVALALGGWVWGRKADASADPIRLFWKLEIAVGIVTALSFLVMWAALKIPAAKERLYSGFDIPQQPLAIYVEQDNRMILSKKLLLMGLFDYFLPILIMVLPAGLLMGGGLPVLDRIAIDRANLSGRRVGDVHLANIAGSVGGTLAVSFVLLPNLGSELTLKILSALTLSFLGFYWWRRKNMEKGVLLGPLLLIFLIVILPGKGQFYTLLYKEATNSSSVVVHESGDGLLALTFRGEQTNPSSLWIGGVKHSFFPSTGEYERSALTCAAAGRPRRVLIIGLGGANTANLVASLPGVEEVVIVELMQDLGGFLDEYVPVAQAVFDRPFVHYISDDGRRYLYANPQEKFDMIFIDPLWSFTAGHNSLYSQEAMRLYREHLTEKGIFCAWINERQFIPHTATTVFAHMDFFPDYLVNSDQPIQYDLSYLSQASQSFLETSSAFLTASATDELNPRVILERLRKGWRNASAFKHTPPPLTDMTPWLEYYYFCPPQFLRMLHAKQLHYCLARY